MEVWADGFTLQRGVGKRWKPTMYYIEIRRDDRRRQMGSRTACLEWAHRRFERYRWLLTERCQSPRCELALVRDGDGVVICSEQIGGE